MGYVGTQDIKRLALKKPDKASFGGQKRNINLYIQIQSTCFSFQASQPCMFQILGISALSHVCEYLHVNAKIILKSCFFIFHVQFAFKIRLLSRNIFHQHLSDSLSTPNCIEKDYRQKQKAGIAISPICKLLWSTQLRSMVPTAQVGLLVNALDLICTTRLAIWAFFIMDCTSLGLNDVFWSTWAPSSEKVRCHMRMAECFVNIWSGAKSSQGLHRRIIHFSLRRIKEIRN